MVILNGFLSWNNKQYIKSVLSVTLVEIRDQRQSLFFRFSMYFYRKLISSLSIYICVCVCVCVCAYIYEVSSINFQTFFVQASKIVIDSWKFSLLLLYILWDHWPIFMISGPNEQLQQELEYTLLKPDCHSWWISKMQSGHEEQQYTVKFCFKLGKMPEKCMECFKLLFNHLGWIEHQFLRGIRDSRKAGSLWGMMRGVGGVRKSEHQSWLAK